MSIDLYVGPNDDGEIPEEYEPLQDLADEDWLVNIEDIERDGDVLVPKGD